MDDIKNQLTGEELEQVSGGTIWDRNGEYCLIEPADAGWYVADILDTAKAVAPNMEGWADTDESE